jgi:hypothetical protein
MGEHVELLQKMNFGDVFLFIRLGPFTVAILFPKHSVIFVSSSTYLGIRERIDIDSCVILACCGQQLINESLIWMAWAPCKLLTRVPSRVTVHLLPGNHINYPKQSVFVFVPVCLGACMQFRDEFL